jgi:TolB-like protein/Flp pilus assembly protein TadD
MGDRMSGLSTIIRELRRRRVFRTAVLYVVAAWVVLQVADLAFAGLGIPESAIRFIWIGAFLGFPLVLIFGWIYDVTADGIVRTAPLGADESADLSLKTTDYVLLAALLVVAGVITTGLISEIREAEVADEVVTSIREIQPNSIAVLPLNNLTGDAEQDYFVDGMHETLTAVMAQISALRVISRTSTDVYRAVSRPLPEIARELGVAHIIEGSVLRSGERVQITLQLIDAETDEHLWAENFDRDLKDILTLQSEVARTVAERIQVKLTLDEETRLADTREVNPETYRAYLRGIYHLNQFTPEGFQKGLGYLHEAVINDPGDPLAYAALARGYSLIGHSPNPPPDAWARARSAATQALLLDADFPEAHTALAEIRLYYDWDWDGARKSFERAIELNPSQDWAHAHYGWYFQLTGDADKAIEEMKKAQEIGPLMPLWPTWVAWLYWGEGDLDEALAYAKKSLDLDPGFPWGMYVLGGVYGARGEYEESLAMFERLKPILPNVANWGFAITYAEMGRRDDALKVAAALAENPGQKDKMFLGMIHGTLGNKEEALKWMEAAHEAHTDWFPWIAAGAGSEMTRRLDVLADEPRFQALIAGLELPVKSPDY